MINPVLVTGATGFIGRHVVAELLRRGHEVHSVGRSDPFRSDVRHHAVDLLQRGSLDATLSTIRPRYLVHLAWIVEPKICMTSTDNIFWLEASLALLAAFRKNGGSRSLIAGTCAEYMWGSDVPFDEVLSPIAPATLYGVSKDALRRVALAYAAECKMSVAWARVFYLYGPYERRGRLISDAINALLSGDAFATSAVLQRRDFMHVEDVAAALVSLLFSDVSGPVNIASGYAPTVQEILGLIAMETGTEGLIRFGARPAPADDPAFVGASVKRLREEVGFFAARSLNSGIRDTVDWWRQRRET